MKLLREDMERSEDESPLDLFNQGIRSEATRYGYTKTLQQVVCEFFEEMLEGTFEERVAQLVKYGKDEPDWTRDLLIKLAKKLRERARLAKDDPNYLNPTTVPTFFKPVKKLFDMNDVAMRWKRIYAFYPELDNMSGSAGWTRAEIAGMLRHTRDTQARAMILVLASSGVRVGALPDLNWGDLKPVYRVGDRLTLDPGEESGELVCAALEVYRRSSEGYTTFVTPEAFAALQEYGREWSEAMDRQAGSKDPMFISTKGVPKRMAYSTTHKRLAYVVRKSGLRDAGKENRRYGTPLMNGFRRFFNKTCKEALSGSSTLGSLIKHEYMMGHHGLTNLDENYFKTDALDLAADYVKVVPDLTIDDADRLRLSNRRMADNVRRLEGEKEGEIARVQKEMARMEAKIAKMERSAKEKDEKLARLEREKAEMAARGGSEKDAEMARMGEEMARVQAEAARTQEEVAKLKQRSGVSIPDMLAALRELDETDGISKMVVDSLTGTFQSLAKAQEDTIREMKDDNAAKTDRMMRTMEWLAEKAGIKYDPKAEFGKDEPPETDPRHHDPRDSGLC